MGGLLLPEQPQIHAQLPLRQSSLSQLTPCRVYLTMKVMLDIRFKGPITVSSSVNRPGGKKKNKNRF